MNLKTRHEHSFGIIPLQQQKNRWFVFLVQHQAGHWSFPKGHAEAGETPKQTAERELFEETGLKIERFLLDQLFEENYFFTANHEKIHKTVIYYLALVQGEVAIQSSELQRGKWLAIEEAVSQITFPEGKRICKEVIQALNLNFELSD